MYFKRFMIIIILSPCMAGAAAHAGEVLTAGSINSTASTPTAIVVNATAPSGGVPPYSYHWYRSTTPDSGLGTNELIPLLSDDLSEGNGIQGSATLVLVDGSKLIPHKLYYYTLVATDIRNQKIVYRPQGATLALQPIIILYISDSIHTLKQLGNTVAPAEGRFPNSNTNDSVPTLMGSFLGVMGGLRSVTIVNQSRGGSSSEDWRPDNSATQYFAKALAELNAAKAANPNAKVYACITHGTNDCHAAPRGAPSHAALTVERHVENLQAMIKALTAAGCDGISINSSPSFTNPPEYFFEGSSNAHIPFGPAQKALLFSYRAAERAMANGATVKYGEGAAFEVFEQRPALLYDGVHLTDDGIKLYAMLDALAFHDNWLKSGN